MATATAHNMLDWFVGQAPKCTLHEMRFVPRIWPTARRRSSGRRDFHRAR